MAIYICTESFNLWIDFRNLQLLANSDISPLSILSLRPLSYPGIETLAIKTRGVELNQLDSSSETYG